MAVFRCARCERYVDIDHEEYVTIPATTPSKDEMEVCFNCATDEEFDANMPCECNEHKCDECNSRNEGEGYWGPER